MGKLRSILNANDIDVTSVIRNILTMTNGAYFNEKKTILYKIPTHATATYRLIERSSSEGRITSILNGKNSTLSDDATVVSTSVFLSETKKDLAPINVFYNERGIYLENDPDVDYLYIEAEVVAKEEDNIAESYILEIESMLFGFLMRDSSYVYKAIQRIDINLVNNLAENKRPVKSIRKTGRITPCPF